VLCPIFRTGIVQATWPNAWVSRALNPFSIAVHADSLAVGCLGAIVFWRYRDRLKRFAAPSILAAALVVFVIAAAGDGRLGRADALVPLVESFAVLCAIWVTVDVQAGPLYWLLNSKAVVLVGVLSYSLYVWQTLFIAYAAGPTLSVLPIYDWRVWWLGAVLCACLSYYVVERPVLRFRDGLRDRLKPDASTTAAVAPPQYR
jgi:peptidoglycan/LPS O-acetylase OafA/YrhL